MGVVLVPALRWQRPVAAAGAEGGGGVIPLLSEINLPVDHTPALPTADADLYTDLDWALAELAAVEGQIADLDARKKGLRETVSSFLADCQTSRLDRPLATVRMIEPTETVTYDRRALDSLAASDPEIGRILSPHRKVTVRAGYVKVEWAKDGVR